MSQRSNHASLLSKPFGTSLSVRRQRARTALTSQLSLKIKELLSFRLKASCVTFPESTLRHFALPIPSRINTYAKQGEGVGSNRTTNTFAAAALALIASTLFSGLSFAAPRHAHPLTARATERASPPAQQTALDPHFVGKLPISQLTADEAVLQALNRLGYGPRPGDLDRIKAMGLEKWIDRQLHPDSIDDSALEIRMATLPAVSMSARGLLATYPQPDAAAKRMGVSVEDYRKRVDQLAHPPVGSGIDPQMSILPQEVVTEMQQAKVMRALYSERQLQQQLTDFWLNHFNVFVNKDLDLWLLEPYERDIVAPRVLGSFRELLGATAQSPAMLFYLDNYLSADPNAFDRLRHMPAAQRAPAGAPPVGGKRGLNENYGRELMELHTLGVDGGYTQQDVVEVARAFTGWTIRAPRENPEFYFDDRLHDPDPKRVLGKKIKAGGIKDGEQVLDLLSKNPHTAHHVALQMALRFVSDTPPPALVDRMAQTFRKSHGDLRAVMRAMIYSPEFWSRETYRAKVKTPFELVVSAARALGANVGDSAALVNWVTRIGEPLYQCQPPTGYADRASAWVNSGSLLNRMNYAITLASNQVRGASVFLPDLLGPDAVSDPYQALDHAESRFLAGQLSDTTRATLERESADTSVMQRRGPAGQKQVNLGLISGLVLGSPEFQQR